MEFGLQNILSDPLLTVYESPRPDLHLGNAPYLVGLSNTWSNSPTISLIGAEVGAFPLMSFPSGVHSNAALYEILAPNSYTALVSSDSGLTNGVALVEMYDTGAIASARTRLVNVSARGVTGQGANVLTAGFVINGGSTGDSKTVLLRGVGPSLASKLPNTLQDPVITLYNSKGEVILSSGNGGWFNEPNYIQIERDAAKVGAFALTSNADAAQVATLPEGAYTLQVSSPSGGSGIVLAEVYDDDIDAPTATTASASKPTSKAVK